jgi:hypothetical protein
MTCPLLEYRDGDGDRSFDVARAYCTAVDAFVQPMRADVCNDRYDLHHADDCEFYHQHGTTPDDGTHSGAVTGSGEEA